MTQIYVAKWGDDGAGDGLSWATAYLTVTKALADVTDEAGDQVNVAPGEYEECLDLRSLADTTLNLLYGAIVWADCGTSEHPVLRIGDRCVVKGGGTLEQRGDQFVIVLTDVDDVQLLDVTLDGGGYKSVIASGFVNLTVQRCRILGGDIVLSCTNGTGLRMIDTDVLTTGPAQLDTIALKILAGAHFIRGGSIASQMTYDADRKVIAMELTTCDLRIVDVVVEAHSAKITTAATDPAIAVDVIAGGNVVLDGCTIQTHADHVDTTLYDLRTNKSSSLGVLNLTHRTTYDSNKVSGPIVTGVEPAREWYCERADLEKVFGIANVAIWADLDADEDLWKVQQRVEDTCEDTSVEVEDLLRRAGFTIPLADADGELPKRFVRLVATLAGVNLYEARGIEDSEEGNNRLRFLRKRTTRELELIATGVRRTTLVRTGGVTPSTKALSLATKI